VVCIAEVAARSESEQEEKDQLRDRIRGGNKGEHLEWKLETEEDTPIAPSVESQPVAFDGQMAK
jgi:hypothetical protein